MEYFLVVGNEKEQFRADYKEGLERSRNYFEQIIGDFEERGLAGETLFIHTSDHGEILGEYGYLGHNHLACPELVRVPTAFVHDDVSAGYNGRLVHNVDIVPIILDQLGLEAPQLDGFNSLDQSREWGYNHYENMFYTTGLDRFDRIVRSVWDDEGGLVRHEGGRLQATLIFLGLLLKSIHGKQIRLRGNILNAYRRFTGSVVYDSPRFSEREFETTLDSNNKGKTRIASQRDLSDEELEHLKDLGYI